jgi:hypothetical protein
MTFEREVAEADSAQREFAQVAATATAPAAAVMHARLEDVQVHAFRLRALDLLFAARPVLLFNSEAGVL